MNRMSKEAYYFSHDSNAHKDPKVLKLRMKHGWEGYGIYWAIIETLREQNEYRWPSNDKELLCYSFANGEPIVNQVVNRCIEIGLLIDDGKHIYSHSLLKRMDMYEEKRKKRVEAGKKGAQKRWGNNDPKGNHKQTNGNANGNAIAKDGKGKERKVKESKRNNNYSHEFEEFWKVYPRKIEKKQAAKKFNSALKRYTFEKIMEGTKQYAETLKRSRTEEQFIKHASTFLNNDSFLEYGGREEEEKENKEQDKIDAIYQRRNELQGALELSDGYYQMMGEEIDREATQRELNEIEQWIRDHQSKFETDRGRRTGT